MVRPLKCLPLKYALFLQDSTAGRDYMFLILKNVFVFYKGSKVLGEERAGEGGQCHAFGDVSWCHKLPIID